MTDLLRTGAQWLAQQQRDTAATPVLYARGADAVTVPATLGETLYEQDDGAGGVTRFQRRDFVILVTDLVLAGDFAVPREGDTITQTELGVDHVFTVSTPVGGEAPWRFTGPHQAAYRVHAVLSSPMAPSPLAVPGGGTGV